MGLQGTGNREVRREGKEEMVPGKSRKSHNPETKKFRPSTVALFSSSLNTA